MKFKYQRLFRDRRLGAERVLLFGEYIGDPHTVAVDANGNIVSVMKGNYDTTLKTITLDEHGRMLAVLTDPEDVFGNPTQMGAAELAARLGSINTYERRGNTVWMDDFEDSTFKWDKSVSGITINRSTESVFMKNYSVKFDLGSAAANWGEISRQFHAPKTTRVGLECAFALHDTNIQYATMSLGIYDGSELHLTGLDFRPETNAMHYGWRLAGISAISTDPFATIDIPEGDSIYSHMKLVIDTETNYHVKAFINNVEYDLSSYEMFHVTTATPPKLIIGFHLNHGASVAATHCYADNFILTQNEP